MTGLMVSFIPSIRANRRVSQIASMAYDIKPIRNFSLYVLEVTMTFTFNAVFVEYAKQCSIIRALVSGIDSRPPGIISKVVFLTSDTLSAETRDKSESLAFFNS
jgi:hypothetical protein